MIAEKNDGTEIPIVLVKTIIWSSTELILIEDNTPSITPKIIAIKIDAIAKIKVPIKDSLINVVVLTLD
jgi:hypothetical protein